LNSVLTPKVSFKNGKPYFEWSYYCNANCNYKYTLTAKAKQALFGLVRKHQGNDVLADLKRKMLVDMRKAAKAKNVEDDVKSDDYV
jgi:hypothetical protein